eukprot:1767826-Rhodomonas_salina.1
MATSPSTRKTAVARLTPAHVYVPSPPPNQCWHSDAIAPPTQYLRTHRWTPTSLPHCLLSTTTPRVSTHAYGPTHSAMSVHSYVLLSLVVSLPPSLPPTHPPSLSPLLPQSLWVNRPGRA